MRGRKGGSTWVQGAQPHQFGVRCTVVPVSDSKKFIISSKYRGPARVHRGDNIDADVFGQSVRLFYIYQNVF